MRLAKPRTSDTNPLLPINLPSPLGLPGHIQPEMATPCVDAFDSENWVFEIDWEGVRALLFADKELHLQNERLRDITELFPEISQALEALDGRKVILDGKICVLDPRGGPDLSTTVLRTLGLADPEQYPAVFLANDILYLDGAPIIDWPLGKRRDALLAVVARHAHIQIPEWFPSEGSAFADAVAERDMGAVIARKLEAPYRPGVASPDRLRIALSNQIDLPVIDGHISGKQVTSLTVGEYVDGTLQEIGQIPLDFPAAFNDWLVSQFDNLPELVATVTYAGRDYQGKLHEPICLIVRNDIDPMRCVRWTPALPPDGSNNKSRFEPTVIPSLPLLDA